MTSVTSPGVPVPRQVPFRTASPLVFLTATVLCTIAPVEGHLSVGKGCAAWWRGRWL